jgi:hypothetical protein
MDGHMETGVAVTIAIFLLGVVYAAGRLSARVDHLEKWREEAIGDLAVIKSGVESMRNRFEKTFPN